MGYNEAPSGHTLFTGERDVKDFKPQTLVNLSEAPALEEVPELSEYRHGHMIDGASTFKLATFGKVLSLSRQALETMICQHSPPYHQRLVPRHDAKKPI
ncbi:MAG: hypothetical protein IPF71_07035 [Rhodoferax sp.]|nr:hypothetical protein [Rhodoferax sp.]